MQILLRFSCFLLLIFTGLGTNAQTLDMDLFDQMKARNIGPAGMSGRVTSIAVHPTDTDIIYIGTAAGGVWLSENAGHTWEPIFENELAASIGDIQIWPKNPNIIYVGTGEGNPRNSQNSGWGMYKSIDGGKSWIHLGLENTRQIHRVLIHPENSDVVWAGVTGASWGDSEHRGVYKSLDGGQSWQKILYINDRTGVSDMVMDPANPNKIIVGMWEHRRWPWTFRSGGAGSGLYITTDGGATWERKTTDDGLPEGDLGRIGLSFAPSNTAIAYAYIESKANAIFRTDDGGESWKQVSKKGDENIGGRPFYYADIYVDVKNENRIYSIASEVTVSEDGGKTWSMFVPGSKVHTDHHAWWAHPQDQEFIMLGHDGGLNITQDRGKNWWFADNLPLGQFYHLRVDNEVPYNVYGGLQDNGSWRGPSQVWFKGGIRNLYWQRLSIGDGFDMIPDPQDNEYGYSMGQGGNLFRYHYPSGQLQRIQPQHPEGEHLRFNWNAGIAIDPHDQKTVYYGSQYLLKSEDYGESWSIISPDLTTNDPEKAQFLETGGLTYDVTDAENHLTIISIAPSELKEGLIWVGTDDGQLHVTQDGGDTWTGLINNIKGVPANTWITHIYASAHNPAEAFVVFDDHRRNNWEPYIYRTQDYGKSWTRILDQTDARGYALTFVQDPTVENLYFAGTEFGLYVSADAGATWTAWQGLPTMPIQDMVIHPRELDLVIATFGRSFWILDDIRPLQEIAKTSVAEAIGNSLKAFPAPVAYLANIGESIGYRQGKIGDALYEGENRPYGALISFHIPKVVSTDSEDPFADQVKIDIKTADGELLRTLYHKPKNGINRVNWQLDRDGVRMPQRPKPGKATPPPSGTNVPTGKYVAEISYNGQKASTNVEVLPDPRLETPQAAMMEKHKVFTEFYGAIEKATAHMDKLREMKKNLDFIREKIKDSNDTTLSAATEKISRALKAIEESVIGAKKQGIYRNPETLAAEIGNALYLLDSPLVPYSNNQKIAMQEASQGIDTFVQTFNKFVENEYQTYQQTIKDAGISIFN